MIEFQLNSHRYPTWASLARDYLSIMASSVLSERAFSAFSSAGITISKRHNRLKGEAMQCLKSIYHNHLLFREVLVSSKIESELDKQDIIDVDLDSGEVFKEVDVFSWDKLIIDEGALQPPRLRPKPEPSPSWPQAALTAQASILTSPSSWSKPSRACTTLHMHKVSGIRCS